MKKKLELYIHIPFCVRKCLYCDFVSFAGKEGRIDEYVRALCDEIGAVSGRYADFEISSVYIGGGTPSLLNPDQISILVRKIYQCFDLEGTYEKRKGLYFQKKIRPQVEFSIECNPGTVDAKKLKTYRKLGINRLSIGLQSTDEADLKALGRIHSFEDFENTFEAARSAGFDNINIDLMQAIPGQSLSTWKKVLALASMFRPEHISAYSLIIEDGTPFKSLYDSGKLNLPDEDEEREIYHYTKEFLEKAGYRRYEISNYALPDFECRHNIGYWTRENYLGLGLNASSMVENERWKNTADLDRYLSFSENPQNTIKNEYQDPALRGYTQNTIREDYQELTLGGHTQNTIREECQDFALGEQTQNTIWKEYQDPALRDHTQNTIREEYQKLTLREQTQNTIWKEYQDPALRGHTQNTIREEYQKLTIREQMEEFVFLGLRLTDGISKQKFFDTFHQDFDFTFGEKLQQFIDMDLIISSKDNVKFTDKGTDVSNHILSRLLLD